MPILKLEGLVLRNLRMGDTSRVVTLLSRELGKWSGVAKGVRAPKSRFGASLELLSHSDLVVYFRPGRDLQVISDGTLETEFRGLLGRSERFHFACAVTEFLDRILEEEVAFPELFDLTLRVLALMESAPVGRLSYLLRAFQLRVAGWLGYAPRLGDCVVCRSIEGAAGFSPIEGGVVCPGCLPGHPSSLPISQETLGLLRSLQKGSLPRDPSVAAVREVDRIAEAFLSTHIDRYRGLRSLRALGDLGRLKHPDGASSG
ncbi:MAG: DNA repair protein RecO [Candidatus Eisenbacteria bacterium]|nr:DNA repair protein RecO [Candidatus Latescibacterota bacterium]MBD3302504.1 DNA repair protein RecO [Candidatus Eisenbacteria bacterium]